MSRIVFVENRSQVVWIKESLRPDSQTMLIALTAEALQALEEISLPHQAVSVYADARKLASVDDSVNRESVLLASEIESFISDNYTPARFEGPGFLSAQGYWLQYSILAIATRAFLMLEAIRACSPEVISIFDMEIDPWFSGDGYARNPWFDVVEVIAKRNGWRVEALASPPQQSKGTWMRLGQFARRAQRYAYQRISEFSWSRSSLSRPGWLASAADLRGLRLLFAGSAGYDWELAVQALRSTPDAESFVLGEAYLDNRHWTNYYSGHLRPVRGGPDLDLDLRAPRADKGEARCLAQLFDDWLNHRRATRSFTVLGMDMLQVLIPHLRVLSILGPALARHADAVATWALDAVKPEALCFFAMPYLSAQRLAFRARQRGIPVLCYQHGGVYGTHVAPKNEQTDSAHADYYLTYGSGIIARTSPVFPVRAEYVPVGSSRIEALVEKALSFRRPRKNGTIHVLWIAEFSTRNTVGGTLQVEDTERYLLQRRCLEMIGRNRLCRVIYRPYVHQVEWDGTARWIQEAELESLRMDLVRPLDALIRASDVVISDTSSGTVWNEVLALKKPLVLYCDPRQTPLMEHFAADLEHACLWCKTAEDLIETVRRLVDQREKFLEELQRHDPVTFLRKYVLHEGECAIRVLAFLNRVRRGKQSSQERSAPAGPYAPHLVEPGTKGNGATARPITVPVVE